MEVTVASAVFAAVRGGAGRPAGVARRVRRDVVVSVLTGALLLVAVGRLQGACRAPTSGVWLGPLVLGAVLTTSAALVALVVGQADLRAVALLLVLAVSLAGGYRVYGRLLHRHQVLQLLQSFTAALGAGGSAASLLSASLGHTRALLAADVARWSSSRPVAACARCASGATWSGPPPAQERAGVVARCCDRRAPPDRARHVGPRRARVAQRAGPARRGGRPDHRPGRPLWHAARRAAAG
jgi:hypothetical protein